MKNKALTLGVLFIMNLMSCQAQTKKVEIKDDYFKEYVSVYQVGTVPFSTLEEKKIKYHDFNLNQVRKFICENDTCLIDWSGYKIEFASYLKLPSHGLYIVLIHDESTEGGTIRKLSTYDNNGNRISTLDIFADKPSHGHRELDEISYLAIESIIDSQLTIQRKYFEAYPSFSANNIRLFYGRYIETTYQITSTGEIQKITEQDHGKQKYIGKMLGQDEFPRWKVYME